MKRNETANAIILNCRCNYTHFVTVYSNVILTCQFYREFKAYKNLSYPFVLEGNLNKKGNKFMLRRPDLGMNIYYELIESIITDYYSRFKYFIYKTVPESFQYFHQIEVRHINENECTILSSLIYDNKIFFPEKDIQDVVQLQKSLYNTIALSMRKYTVLKLSTAYTVINSDIELIWNIIRNMKMIHKYVHLLGDKINYNGEILKKNIIMKLSNIKGRKDYISIAKVNKCKMIKNDSTKECVIELLFQKEKEKEKEKIPPFSEAKIILRIYELDGRCSMYILYFFSNVQDYNIVENSTKIKNQELIKFKNMVENYKANNSNNNLKKEDENLLNVKK